MHHINVLVLPSWRRYSRSTISEYFLPVIVLTDRESSEFVHGDNHVTFWTIWLQLCLDEDRPSCKMEKSPSINSVIEDILILRMTLNLCVCQNEEKGISSKNKYLNTYLFLNMLRYVIGFWFIAFYSI